MVKVLVGMSGGIDSSVAAWLLKEQGYSVAGVTMSIWKPDRVFRPGTSHNACFSPDEKEDIEKAKQVCGKIGIPHITLDISDAYQNIVLKNFREEYLNGRTPNPCVWCNQKIKFGAMVQEARAAGLEFDFFATGHYARIEKAENGRYALKKGADASKDQSYFLYRLSQEQLSQTLFPLGTMTKAEVRKLDVELGFHGEEQTESQDFYSGDYADLLDVEPKEGFIVDVDGKILGKHNGMWNYTIGQRRGLGIAAPKPLYVIGLNPAWNEVVVGYEDKTANTRVTASEVNWVSVNGLEAPVKAGAKIRSTGIPVPCTVGSDPDGRIYAEFETPVRAAACGQSLVVYDGDTVLCGGIISSAV